MENKYNQHTVLLTGVADALLHLVFQTIRSLHMCAAHYNEPDDVNVNTSLHKYTTQQQLVIGKKVNGGAATNIMETSFLFEQSKQRSNLMHFNDTVTYVHY